MTKIILIFFCVDCSTWSTESVRPVEHWWVLTPIPGTLCTIQGSPRETLTRSLCLVPLPTSLILVYMYLWSSLASILIVTIKCITIQKNIWYMYMFTLYWEIDWGISRAFVDPCSLIQCQQICVNTPSGPNCLCGEGFSLEADGLSCKGILFIIIQWYMYISLAIIWSALSVRTPHMYTYLVLDHVFQ